jgi:hypothetical protein
MAHPRAGGSMLRELGPPTPAPTRLPGVRAADPPLADPLRQDRHRPLSTPPRNSSVMLEHWAEQRARASSPPFTTRG